MNSVCVFCGSSPGANPIYQDTAIALGHELARRSLRLVYGGGNIGLMGAVADAVLEARGHVIGVIPQALVDKEVGHHGVSELIIVDSMHERKARMAALADAFLALPGGFGTIEEFVEVLTWAQLGLHTKPCGLLNVAGFYDSLLTFFDHAVDQRFLRAEFRRLVLIGEQPSELLDQLEAYRPVVAEKRIDWS